MCSPKKHADTLMAKAVYFHRLRKPQTLAATKLCLPSLPQLLCELQPFQAPEVNGRQLDVVVGGFCFLNTIKRNKHLGSSCTSTVKKICCCKERRKVLNSRAASPTLKSQQTPPSPTPFKTTERSQVSQCLSIP